LGYGKEGGAGFIPAPPSLYQTSRQNLPASSAKLSAARQVMPGVSGSRNFPPGHDFRVSRQKHI
jgi:hypothetical protein